MRGSLVPERLHGIEARGAASRADAEDETDADRHAERHHHGVHRHHRLPSSEARDPEREQVPEPEADQAAEERDHHRLDQELQEDVAAPRADVWLKSGSSRLILTRICTLPSAVT